MPPKVCAYCAGTWTPKRSDARTCSPACRKAESRRRRGYKPPTRRRRTSRARAEATGAGVVEEHGGVPAAALRFRPTEDGGALLLEGDDGRGWKLLDLGLEPGAPWRLLELRPGPWVRRYSGEVLELRPAHAAHEGPATASRRSALVWALLQVHRRTARGFWLACVLEERARELRQRAQRQTNAQIRRGMIGRWASLFLEASAVRSASSPKDSRPGDWSGRQDLAPADLK